MGLEETKLPSNCPDKAELKAFHFGDLSEGDQNAIATHLEYCTDCEGYLFQLDRSADEAIAALRFGDKLGIPFGRPRIVEGLRIGDYEVIEEIGHGGMGLVCKARHVVLHRIVALKMLIAGELANADCSSRFAAEAQAMARLKHANIVQIYEIGTWKRSEGCELPFLAMEYVPGGNLSERIRGRPQPSAIAAQWIETLAMAVQHAHENGVVHRDLKPSNVLFDTDGRVKLCDFGVAKLVSGSEMHTRTGVLVGTPEYMAPEQASEGQQVGAAADVWALGAILYTLLTGSPPFVDSDTVMLLQKIRVDDPVSPRLLQRAIVRDLDTVCMKCLQKDVNRRYTSAAELAAELARIREGRPIQARPVGVFEQSWKWSKRHPVAATTIAWFFLLAMIGLPILTWLWLQAETARSRADENVERAESALYFNRIALARQGIESEGIDQTLLMLERCRPVENARDRRNWEWRYLNRQAKLGHRDGLDHFREGDIWTWINAVAWSPDGKRLVSVGGPVADMTPGKVRIWDSESWQCLFEYDQPGGAVIAAAWHPLQPLLMTGSADGKVYEWDMDGKETSQPFWQLPQKNHSVRHLQFSPDGKLLAIGTTGGLYLYDLDARSDRLIQSAEWPGVASIDFRTEVDDSGLPSTRLLAAFTGKSDDGQLALWDVTTSSSIKRLATPSWVRTLTCGAFAKGDTSAPIAIAELRSSDVELWSNGANVFLDRLRGHRGGLLDVKFAVNGTMATAGEDGTVRVWDIATHVERAAFRGHSDGVRKINFSPDGTRLASCGQDLRICIWNVDTDPRGFHFQGTQAGGGEYAGGLAFSTVDDALVLVSQANQSILRYNFTNGELLSSVEIPMIKSYSYARRDQVLQSNAAQLASSDPEHPGILKIWDVQSGKLKASLVHESKPVCVAWSDDGSVIVTTSESDIRVGQLDHKKVDTHVRVWDSQTGKQRNQWVIGGERVTGLSVDIRGELVAAAIGEMPQNSGPISPSRVVVWEAKFGVLRHQFHGCEGLIPALCFRPDSRQLAAVGFDSQIVYSWDLDGSKNQLKRQASAVPTSIVYSPDGQRIAVGCYDNRIRIWDSRTANEAISLLCLGLPGNGNYAFKSWVAFSPDGRHLAATDWQGQVTVWDAPFAD